MNVFVEYQNKKGFLDEEMAALFGVSDTCVRAWKKGRMPSFKNARKIEKKTKGQIKAEDLGWTKEYLRKRASMNV